VRADEEGLQQILDNLVDNAIKYTPDGGRVLVRWTPEPMHVRIEIDDNGIGIPAEYQPRLFERFFRVDKARSRELGGTGLGLSIVKHLAQSFGGGVGVESEPGSGSTFYVELPVAPAVSCEETTTDDSTSLPAAVGKVQGIA
jgi:two-component system phosphate regulon sensor histidine kinase PhoR